MMTTPDEAYRQGAASAAEAYRLAAEYQGQARGEFIRQAHESQRENADRPELGGPVQDPGSMGQPQGHGQR
jgi:hypothetical protein